MVGNVIQMDKRLRKIRAKIIKISIPQLQYDLLFDLLVDVLFDYQDYSNPTPTPTWNTFVGSALVTFFPEQ